LDSQTVNNSFNKYFYQESQTSAEQLRNDLNFLQRKLNSEQIHGDFDDVHIRKLTSSLDQAKEV